MSPAGLLLAGLAWLSESAEAVPHQPPTIVAHRGLAEGVPENTLAALRQSIGRGVSVIEVDIRQTSDGALIILHDRTLDRTTDCSGKAAKLRLVQVQACDAGAGERVPTLAQALAVARDGGAKLLLDIKPGTDLGATIRAVRSEGAGNQVIFGLRQANDIATVRAELPGATTLGFMPRPDDAAAFAIAGANIIRLWSDWVEADPRLVERTRTLGTEPWIMIGRRLPDRSPEWRELHEKMIATGASGLITDRPELIARSQ